MKRLSLPTMHCDDGCGICCTVVPCTQEELQAVTSYAKDHNIQPISQGLTCPWFQKGTCQVYPVRPHVCQLFGHVKSMTCPKGYNRNIPTTLERKLNRGYANGTMPDRLLHEAIPNYETVIKEAITNPNQIPTSIPQPTTVHSMP